MAFLDGLARAEFLHERRVRAWAIIAASVTVAVVVFGLATSSGVKDMLDRPIGTDFISFWTASRVALSEPITEVWNVTRHAAEQRVVFGDDDTYAAFFYPPVFLFFCLPLGYLSYLAALAAWMVATLGAAGATLWRWADGRISPLYLVAFPAVFSTLGHGQNAFLSTAIFAGGGLLLARRPVLAGMVLGILVYKPHLAVALPLALAASGQWRAFVAMGTSAVALMAASAAAFGIESWRAFFGVSWLVRHTLEHGLADPGKMISTFRAARQLELSIPTAWWLHGTVACVVLVVLVMACRRRPEPRAVVAASAAATVLVSPYMLDYDLMLSAVPMAWLVLRGMETGFLPWEKVGLLLAFCLPAFARPMGLELGLPVAPSVALGFFAIVVRRMFVDAEAARVGAGAPAGAQASSSSGMAGA